MRSTRSTCASADDLDTVAARLIWWSLAAWLLVRALDVAVTLTTVSGDATARLARWAFWDARFYGFIAQHGYLPGHLVDSAFFPLYPLLMRPLLAAHLSWQLAAIFISGPWSSSFPSSSGSVVYLSDRPQ